MNLITKSCKFVSKNSTVILAVCASAGVVVTAVFANDAAPKAKTVLEQRRLEYETELKAAHPEEEIHDQDVKLPVKEQVKAVWKIYIPTVTMAGLTIACIVGGTRIGAKRAAALASLCGASEAAFKEYRKTVMEKIGEKKADLVDAAMAEKHISENPVSKAAPIETGNGSDLCYDSMSGRYFYTTTDSAYKAETQFNRRVINEMWASLNEFYSELNLPEVRLADNIGYDVDNPLEIFFSTQMTDDGRPCLVLEYRTRPILMT